MARTSKTGFPDPSPDARPIPSAQDLNCRAGARRPQEGAQDLILESHILAVEGLSCDCGLSDLVFFVSPTSFSYEKMIKLANIPINNCQIFRKSDAAKRLQYDHKSNNILVLHKKYEPRDRRGL